MMLEMCQCVHNNPEYREDWKKKARAGEGVRGRKEVS